jgi:hypothetical protein
MRESQIVAESVCGSYWIADADNQYTVYRNGATHARADSSYPRTDDGLSIAKARMDYLGKRIT